MTDLDIGINSQVRYELAGTGSELFSVDQELGLVTVSDLGGNNLDRESKDTYYLQVILWHTNTKCGALTKCSVL